MCERELWGAVAYQALLDHAKLIRAARRGKARHTPEGGSGGTAVRSEQAEMDAARRYFESRDWRIVASLAGIDADPERLVQVAASDALLAHVGKRGCSREARA